MIIVLIFTNTGGSSNGRVRVDLVGGAKVSTNDKDYDLPHVLGQMPEARHRLGDAPNCTAQFYLVQPSAPRTQNRAVIAHCLEGMILR